MYINKQETVRILRYNIFSTFVRILKENNNRNIPQRCTTYVNLLHFIHRHNNPHVSFMSAIILANSSNSINKHAVKSWEGRRTEYRGVCKVVTCERRSGVVENGRRMRKRVRRERNCQRSPAPAWEYTQREDATWRSGVWVLRREERKVAGRLVDRLVCILCLVNVSGTRK